MDLPGDGPDGRRPHGRHHSGPFDPDPADADRSVEFRESCKSGLNECSYGRPAGKWVKGAVGALGMLEWILIAVCAVAFVMLMLRGLLGVRRFMAIYDRSARDRE